jgi:hypothetical protein
MVLRYNTIEQQLVEALTEIGPSAERYWRLEGAPGQDCGPYIFIESMFAAYVEVLLWTRNSPRRDHLLTRAFDFIDEMIGSDDRNVVNLAGIGVFEGRVPAWFARADRFIGPRSLEYLDRYDADWRLFHIDRAVGQEPTSIIDLYGVRVDIAAELAGDGIRLSDLPGVTDVRE